MTFPPEVAAIVAAVLVCDLEIDKDRDRPLDVEGGFDAFGRERQAPHPHAAVLFIDFLFSPEGQKILENYEYGSAVKEYGFKRWYIEKGMTIQQLERESDRWERALKDLGRK